jgi:hypothetical protein
VQLLAHLLDLVGGRWCLHSESIPPLATLLPPRSTSAGANERIPRATAWGAEDPRQICTAEPRRP